MKKKWLKSILTTGILAGALAIGGCGQNAGTTAETSGAETAGEETGKDDLLAKIQSEGKIIFAMEGTWAPWTYHDEAGELVGFDTEVGKLIARELGVEAEFVEGEWDGLFAGLDGGRYDAVINGVEITDERAEKYDFTEPYGYIHTALIVGSDNVDITSFEDLNGKTTANSLNSTYQYLAQDYGATVSNVDSLGETLEMVLSGRVDATLNADVSFYEYLGQHPDAALKVVDLTEDASKVSIPLRKGAETESLLAAINQAIKNLQASGELAAVSEKYFGSDITSGAFSTADAGSAAAEDVDDELARILEEGVLKVGVEGTYPPITYHDENNVLTGFDIEVAQAIGEKLGVEVEFVEAEWDSLLLAVDSGRIDTVINAVSVTDERKEKYDFTEPYVSVYYNVIAKGDNDELQTLEDLNGKKVAENITTTFATRLEELGATIVPIDTLEQSIDLITTGRADFTLLSDISFYPYLEEHPDADVKAAFVFGDDKDQFAIPFKKGETRLVEAVNKALDELKADGTLTAISEKYFNSDVIEKASIE